MSTVSLIGPNGARFQWDEPLPGWLERQIAAGEVQMEAAKPKPAARKKTTSGE